MKYLNPVTAAMGCGLGADVISAYSAFNFLQPGVVGYYRYAGGGTDPTDNIYLASFPGGHAGTARHFLKKILPAAISGEYRMADILNGPVQWDQLDRANEPVRMRLSSTVVAVVHEGAPESAKRVIVTYLRDGKLYKVRAKGAVVCGQQHANRHLCRDISPEYREAMNAFHHAPMHTVNVAVRNWKFLEKLGIASARWFEGFGWWVSLRRNLEIPGQETQPLDPAKPTVLTMYNPFPLPGIPFPQQCTAARMQLFAMSYADIEKAVREQFTKMFGDYGFDADRDIAGIISNRWGHAYVVDPPGFFFGKDGKTCAEGRAAPAVSSPELRSLGTERGADVGNGGGRGRAGGPSDPGGSVMKTIPALAAAVLLAAFSMAATANDNSELAAFKAAIRAKYDMKEKAFAAHDAETIVTKFYTADVVSVGEGEGIYIGRDQLRPLYEAVVKDNLVKIDSVNTFVAGNAGWDWADFNVTPADPKNPPFTFAILFLWAKVDGQWMCKGDFFVNGSFRTGKLTPPPAPPAP